MPEPLFSVSSVRHRVMGPQVRLRFNADFELRFTPAEASSLSLALVAVHLGISPEREIYMSPIASDDAFDGQVTETGMQIRMRDIALDLDWASTNELALSLAKAIEERT